MGWRGGVGGVLPFAEDEELLACRRRECDLPFHPRLRRASEPAAELEPFATHSSDRHAEVVESPRMRGDRALRAEECTAARTLRGGGVGVPSVFPFFFFPTHDTAFRTRPPLHTAQAAAGVHTGGDPGLSPVHLRCTRARTQRTPRAHRWQQSIGAAPL